MNFKEQEQKREKLNMELAEWYSMYQKACDEKAKLIGKHSEEDVAKNREWSLVLIKSLDRMEEIGRELKKLGSPLNHSK